MADVCLKKPEVVISQQCIEKRHRNFWNLPNWGKSPKTKLEVELACRGRHLEKSMWRHNSAGFIRFGWNLAVWCRWTCTLKMPKLAPYMPPKQQMLMKKLNSLQHSSKVAELKQDISQKMSLLRSTVTSGQRAAQVISFVIFAVSSATLLPSSL